MTAGKSLRQFVETGLMAMEVAARALILRKRLLVRVDNEQALIAVHDDEIAAGHVGGERADADHRRDFQHTGHDSRVTGAAACFGGEGVDALGVERRGLAWRQVVGKYDHRFSQLRQLLPALAEETQLREYAFPDQKYRRRVARWPPLMLSSRLGVAAA